MSRRFLLIPGLFLLRVISLACASCVLTTYTRAQKATPEKYLNTSPGGNAKADLHRAATAYLDGARLLERHDLLGAENQFVRAAELDPAHGEYQMAVDMTREHRIRNLIQQAAKARLGNDAPKADVLLDEARKIDPKNELVMQHKDDGTPGKEVDAVRARVTPEIAYTAPIELGPKAGLQDFHLRGDARQVVTRAAQAYGIRVVYDDSAGTQPVRFDLEQSPYKEAMPILLRMTHLFGVPVDTKTLLVAKDTEENRAKYERQVEETIYIPASTTEQMNELSNIIKSVFDVKQVVVSQGSGTMVLRAPAPTLEAVNYTLADMIDGGAQVMLEVKLVSVAKSLTHKIGAQLPASGNVFSAAAEVQSFVSQNQSLINSAISSGAFTPTGSQSQQLVEEAAFLILSGLATNAKLSNLIAVFGHGLTLFGASISGGATFNFGLNSSSATALDDITVRLGDKQTSTLRVGERYPVTTASYSSGISNATSAALAGVTVNGVSASKLLNQYLGNGANGTVPQVQYEELGITLKTTPTVMRSDLIRLSIDMKIESLEGTSLNNIPILTSSVYTSDITVPNGNTVVMLTDLTSTESASVSGLPGLAELPGFNGDLSDKMKQIESSELFLLITPRLVRRRNTSMASRAVPFHSSVPTDF